MNYKKWGAEYLEDARKLKERVVQLRREFRGLRDEEMIRLSSRIAVLYDMYLECLHVGRLLTERGKANERN